MKLAAALLFFASWVVANAVPGLPEMRALYFRSAKEEKACSQLISKLSDYTPEQDPLRAGYRGCALMMMAEHYINPSRKITSFREGRALLEKSILKSNNNTELRYLRFTIQTNAPAFLGYNKSITEDKNFILTNYDGIRDAELKKMISTYLLKSSQLTDSEKAKLKV